MAENGAVIRFGRVINVDDPHGGGRIQVRTQYDTKTRDKDLPWYIPALPKMFFTVPKKDELVIVLSMLPGEHENFNYYLGPLISQENKLFFDDYDNAMQITSQNAQAWGVNPRIQSKNAKILYPDLEDVAIEGRKDTGIQLKDEEIRIKAGLKVNENKGPVFNNATPSFISLKYYPKNDLEHDGFQSTATIVADKINLLGTQKTSLDGASIPSPVPDENSASKGVLISDKKMKEIINKAHQLPFGDTLIEFLDLLREAFAKHVHPFPTMAPCNDENMKSVASYDLKGILSDNVRIN